MTLFGNIFPPLGSLVGLASHFYALHFPAAAERRLSLLPDLAFHSYLCRGEGEGEPPREGGSACSPGLYRSEIPTSAAHICFVACTYIRYSRAVGFLPFTTLSSQKHLFQSKRVNQISLPFTNTHKPNLHWRIGLIYLNFFLKDVTSRVNMKKARQTRIIEVWISFCVTLHSLHFAPLGRRARRRTVLSPDRNSAPPL